MKRSVTVTIAGHRYALKTDADDAYVSELAALVGGRIDQTQRGGRGVPLPQAAMLVALQLADELARERRGRAALRRRVRDQASRLLNDLPPSSP